MAASRQSCCYTETCCKWTPCKACEDLTNHHPPVPTVGSGLAHSQLLNTSQARPRSWQGALDVVVVSQVPAQPSGTQTQLVMQLMPAGNWLTVNQVPSTHSISKLVSELQDSGRLPRTCPPASKPATLLRQPHPGGTQGYSGCAPRRRAAEGYVPGSHWHWWCL